MFFFPLIFLIRDIIIVLTKSRYFFFLLTMIQGVPPKGVALISHERPFHFRKEENV